MIALIREEGRQGPPHTVQLQHLYFQGLTEVVTCQGFFCNSDKVTHDDAVALYPNAELLETNEDLSSVDRLGKIIENVYSIKFQKILQNVFYFNELQQCSYACF